MEGFSASTMGMGQECEFPTVKEKVSSFRKRNVQELIRGTFISPQTGQIITSCGNPSLDVLLGGLPLGSICLIEEDKFVRYSKVLAKYFVAEGMSEWHGHFLASLDDDPEELYSKLPMWLEEDEKTNEEPSNGMRIAWRYNGLPPINSKPTIPKMGHLYNLTKHINAFELFNNPVTWCEMPKFGSAKECTESKATKVAETDDTSEDLHVEGDPIITAQAGDQKRPKEDTTDVASTSSKSETVAEQEKPEDSDDDMLPQCDPDAAGDDMKMEVCTDESEPTKCSSEEPKTPRETTPPTETVTKTTPLAENVNDASQEAPYKHLFTTLRYMRLLQRIKAYISREVPVKGLNRICITSLGSPLWYDDNFSTDLLKFLTLLRSIMTNEAVCLITMPMHLIAKYDASLVPKIRNLVDYSIELQSFAGSSRETNPLYKQYHGLVHVHKIAAINTLRAYMPETQDLAFRLHRKSFEIEKLHLPPEIQEEADEDQKPTVSCSSVGSGTSSKSSLDF